MSKAYVYFFNVTNCKYIDLCTSLLVQDVKKCFKL